MGIFSGSPKSFKIDRKSPLASRLKSSISKKLLQFLGNYSDDVLAEYIIVLVCNGKHQIQARDDLEAFLGERSGEFVSWLWNHLLKYSHESNSALGLLDAKDVTVTGPSSGVADRDLRSNRSKDVQSHGNGNADSSLAKNGKYCHPSAYASSPVPSNNMELSEGIQYCISPVNTDKEQPQKQRSAIIRELGTTEILDDSLAHKPSRIGGSSLIPTGREQSFKFVDNSKKILNHEGNGLRSELLDFPGREMVFRNLQPSIIEGPQTRQKYAANVSSGSSLIAVGEISSQKKKLRGSVWDRLGKPCEENCFVDHKAVVPYAVDIVEKDQEVFDQHTVSVPVHNKELSGNMKIEVHKLDKSCSGNNPGECRKLEQGVSTICKLHAANNIRRKRHFGEISSGPSSCSVSLVGRSIMDHQIKESSQDFKKLNSTSEAASPALVSQVHDVKQRLCQIQMEMCKLRNKQLEMRRDGQPHILPDSGVIKNSEEDVESRTVFVTNVHFAATKEALSFHFAKCGVVLNVVILTDKLNAQPKGSAYITFANKESVEKAVALSGTSLFSRTLKVLRKAEEATVNSTPPEKPLQARFSQINRKTVSDRPVYPSSHLQWRREPVSASSEPSASIIQEKGFSPAASQQQLSGSLASVRTTKTAASSTGTPAAAD